MRFHTQTAGSTLTAQQPLNNVVRTTVQALAATLGGTQSLHTNSYDEAVGLPTEDSARLALRTQQILAFESGVADTVDPFGGSYFMEALTDDLEAAAQELFDQVEELGGAVAAIEAGFMQGEIEDAAYSEARRQASGESVVVGVNRFESGPGEPIEVLRVDPELERGQVERLGEWRRRRGPVDELLGAVVSTAKSGDNLLPVMKDALMAGATVGEVSDALRQVFGRYRPGL
jgi:methylmalonyl-CoA mutase N-terminal domain/subunit